MSAYTDDIISGIFCEGCGVFMGEEVGFPRLCAGCAKERRAEGREVVATGLGGYQDRGERVKKPLERAKCPHCQRKVKVLGMLDHIKAVHSGVVK